MEQPAALCTAVDHPPDGNSCRKDCERSSHTFVRHHLIPQTNPPARFARSLVHARGGGGIPQALEIVAYIKHPPRALKHYISLPSSFLGSPGPIGQGETRRSETKANPVLCPPYLMCSVLSAAGERRPGARGVVISSPYIGLGGLESWTEERALVGVVDQVCESNC